MISKGQRDKIKMLVSNLRMLDLKIEAEYNQPWQVSKVAEYIDKRNKADNEFNDYLESLVEK